MPCPRCQHENPADAAFCQECGARLETACPSCTTPNQLGAKFCKKCGQRLSQSETAQAVPGPRFGSAESYTPKHLAEKILTSKTALEGERKQVTVLFADLKGSMELLADRDPEEARKLLDPVLEHMMEAVHRYEGTVNQVMGDGIMALFGAPLAHEDHAVRACYAALRMQESVKRYAEEVHRTAGVPLHIRVGVNSGEVIVRSIGSDLHMDYTAVGQATHLASRLEQMAMPGSILISPETLNLAEGYVMVKPLGERPVKGLDAPIEVFEVVGAGTVRSRLQAAAARGLTRFVGRDPELEQLRQALERAGAGHGQLVAVVGDPGVGKSRLFWEFTHSHRTQGWLLVESSSVSYGKATAFLPLIELLRTYFQIEARDEARKIREKVTGKLLSLDRALEPSLPALLWLLDVPVDDPQWQRLDPPQRRQQTLDGIKRLLLRESQVQPLLLVFEDLHWIDTETQVLLDSVAESLPTARLLLLVNYRPEYNHAWGSKSYYQQLRIDPLPPESADELLEALLGNDAGLQPLKRLLIERTEGNPFFLEESVRTLVETKVLAGERGAYRLARESHTLQIPATAQAILAARIDRLTPEDKRLLQAASVLGKDVPFALLQSIVEEPEDTLRRGLATLQAAEFLYEARLFPDLEYTFKHALTHGVAYGSLIQDRRRQLHTRIVQAIEHRYPDRLQEYVEQLAHHALKGEVWDKTVSYLRQAGAKAFARSANREAVGCFEQALAALRHLPETRETQEQAIDLRFDLRTALFPLGEFERIVGCLRETEGLARTLDDRRRLGQLSVYMCHNLWITGHPREALAFGESAQAIAESLGDVPLQVTGNLYLGAACLHAGDYRRAEDLLRNVLKLLEGDRSRERFGLAGFPVVLVRYYLDLVFAERGKFEEGIIHGREGIRLAEALDHPYSLAVMCWGLAFLHIIRELSHAVRLLERGLALSREWNLTYFSVMHTGSLGYVYALSGRVAEGIALLEQALSTLETMGFGAYQSLFLAYLGEAHVLAGRLEDALESAGRALTLGRERGQRGDEAWALRLLGEVTAHRDPSNIVVAEGHYGQALALADELGMHPLVAHCHLGLGKLYRRTGDQAKAAEHLAGAKAMYREMGMLFWLEKAEAAPGPPYRNSP
jgi:class 3 adenylate cyclase/tetratricopeptide (TPR) repeat protein